MKGPLNVIRRRPAPESATAPDHSAPPASSLPAGAEAVEAGASFRRRAQLRRRLRFLRRARELGLRDLGGLTFDQHRFEQANPELVATKLAALGTVDSELRAIERALDAPQAVTELREAGIAACPRCTALHASDASFCSACGLALGGPRPTTATAASDEAVESVPAPSAEPATIATAPASGEPEQR